MNKVQNKTHWKWIGIRATRPQEGATLLTGSCQKHLHYPQFRATERELPPDAGM